MSVPPEDENNIIDTKEDERKIEREGKEQQPSDVKEEYVKEIPLDEEQKDISTDTENSGETESNEEVPKTEEEVVESKEELAESEGKSVKMGEPKESIEVPSNQSTAEEIPKIEEEAPSRMEEDQEEEIEENETSTTEVKEASVTQIDELAPEEETLEEDVMSVSRNNIPPRERSDLNKILLSIVFIIPMNFIMSMLQVYIFFTSGMNNYLPWYKDMNTFTEQLIPLGNFTYAAISTVFFLIYISVVYLDAKKRS